MNCGRIEHIFKLTARVRHEVYLDPIIEEEFKLTPRLRFEVCTPLLPIEDDVVPALSVKYDNEQPVFYDDDVTYVLYEN